MNKKNIAIGLSLLTLFALNGCVKKTTTVKQHRIEFSQKRVIQACVGDDCKATIARANPSSSPKPFNSWKKSKTSYQPVIESVDESRLVYNPLDDPYAIKSHVDRAPSVVPSSVLSRVQSFAKIETFEKIDNFSKKASIQVGAFRKYAGAKVYAKRYGLLSRQYKTVIKKDIKDAKPLYRVRIEGFSSEIEAKRFMSKYSLSGAFLVRK